MHKTNIHKKTMYTNYPTISYFRLLTIPFNLNLFMRNVTVAPILFLVFFLFEGPLSFSQQIDPPAFGNVSANDFTLPKSNLIDSSTRAVIMADVGDIHFVGNRFDWVSYVFHQKMRIKLLNKQAFDLATIKVRLRGSGQTADQIDSLQASTYTVENGRVKEVKLDLKDVYKDTLKANAIEARFTLPALSEGCIIEYSYKITSFRFYSLPFWNFQFYNHPCLYDRFEISMPTSMLGYLTILHGLDSFAENRIEKAKERYQMATVDAISNVLHHTWVMVNVPPFKTEPFVDHPYNYRDAIEFYVLQTYGGERVNGSTTWRAVNKELLENEIFGFRAISPEMTRIT